MNSTEVIEQEEIYEWAKKSEDKNIFEKNDDIESFYKKELEGIRKYVSINLSLLKKREICFPQYWKKR